MPYIGSLLASNNISDEEPYSGDRSAKINNTFFDTGAMRLSDIEDALVCTNLRVLALGDNDENFESLYRIYAHNVHTEGEKIEINIKSIKARKFIIRFNKSNENEIPYNLGYVDAVLSCLNSFKPENITFRYVLNSYDMICDLYDE